MVKPETRRCSDLCPWQALGHGPGLLQATGYPSHESCRARPKLQSRACFPFQYFTLCSEPARRPTGRAPRRHPTVVPRKYWRSRCRRAVRALGQARLHRGAPRPRRGRGTGRLRASDSGPSDGDAAGPRRNGRPVRVELRAPGRRIRVSSELKGPNGADLVEPADVHLARMPV